MTFIEDLINKIKMEIQNGNIDLPLETLLFALRGTDIESQLIQIQSTFEVLKKDYISGLISYDMLSSGRSKVVHSILEILKSISERVDLHRNIRLNEKSLWFGEKIHIYVDFSSVFKSESTYQLYSNYVARNFLDANDFLNEIFFKIKEFVPPGTYGRKWILQDSSSHNPVTNEDIEIILKQIPDEWHMESMTPLDFNSHIVHPRYKIILITENNDLLIENQIQK